MEFFCSLIREALQSMKAAVLWYIRKSNQPVLYVGQCGYVLGWRVLIGPRAQLE